MIYTHDDIKKIEKIICSRISRPEWFFVKDPGTLRSLPSNIEIKIRKRKGEVRFCMTEIDTKWKDMVGLKRLREYHLVQIFDEILSR